MKLKCAANPIDWIRNFYVGTSAGQGSIIHRRLAGDKDWRRADYNYAYIIPLVLLYLVWEKRGDFEERSEPSWSGYLVIILGILLFWLGELSGEFFSLYLPFGWWWSACSGSTWAGKSSR